MKAITIWQPYASLIMIGAKQFETRSWSTDYRGPVVVHAAKRWDEDRHADCLRVADALRDSTFRLQSASEEQIRLFYMPMGDTLGKALGVVQLVGCDSMLDGGSPLENEFGDFGPGRYGWECAEPKAFEQPISQVGKQGLWIPDAHVVTAASRLLQPALT